MSDAFDRFGLGEEDRAAWAAAGGGDFAEWLTDRVARRPAGERARRVYGADDVHDFARAAILRELRPGPGDRVLDVGCGGGLLLRDLLTTGATAIGLDHSPDMVALARERAPGAEVHEGDAAALPFADGTFTAVTMCVMLFFLADPVPALLEAHRVLGPGGRLAVFTTGPELKGTPAAPEPLASLGHFHADDELEDLGRRGGFDGSRVVNDRGGQLLTARRAG